VLGNGPVTKLSWRAFAAVALMTLIGVLPASILTARAQSPLTMKCNAVGNISLDDRIAGCTAVIETATAMPQGVIFAHFRRAGFYLQKNELDLAIADYDRIIEHDPNNPIARLRRASAYVRKTEIDLAIADYEKAVELDPRDVYAYLGRAFAYLAKGDTDRAIDDYGRVLQIHPENVSAYAGRSTAYRIKDESDRAIADCNRVMEISPNREFGYLCRGQAYRDKDDIDRALADFDRAVQLNPKELRAHLDVASAHQRRVDTEPALASLDQALQLDPQSAWLYLSRGVVRLGANMLPGAIEDFNRSSELNPKSIYTRLWLEIARKRSGQPGQLAESAGQLDMEKWPAPLIRLFLGDETLDAVLVAADDPSAAKKKGQICEANFYAGELALNQGATDEAVRLLHLAADGCPRTFVEWPAANADLRRLNTKP
jgi:tetratricopeptide (TPR) repeat protein